jgi:hypothetical protein
MIETFRKYYLDIKRNITGSQKALDDFRVARKSFLKIMAEVSFDLDGSIQNVKTLY